VARSKERKLGVLVGANAGGGEAIVTVIKVGRNYRFRHAAKDHLCHPSVRNLEGVRREALLVFGIRDAVFVAA
jgi:hypothetical protein